MNRGWRLFGGLVLGAAQCVLGLVLQRRGGRLDRGHDQRGATEERPLAAPEFGRLPLGRSVAVRGIRVCDDGPVFRRRPIRDRRTSIPRPCSWCTARSWRRSCWNWLPLLPLFRARHPHIKIEVKRSLASRISSEILARETEIGIVSFKPNDTAITAVAVLTDELALIVPPDHPLAEKKVVSVRELGAESFVAHNVPSPYRERVIRTFEKYRTPLNISLEMPTLEAIKRFVEGGMGVALVPRLTAQAEIARGQVAALTVREMKLERKLYLVYRKGATLSHAARAFLRVAREQQKSSSKSGGKQSLSGED